MNRLQNTNSKHKFQHNDVSDFLDWLAFAVLVFSWFGLSVLLNMIITSETIAIVMYFLMLFVVVGGGMWFIYPSLTNKNGYGIMNDDYVHIAFRDNVYHINYRDIDDVRVWRESLSSTNMLPKGLHYCIYYKNPEMPSEQLQLVIIQARGVPFVHKKVKPLEKFMIALKEKADDYKL